MVFKLASDSFRRAFAGNDPVKRAEAEARCKDGGANAVAFALLAGRKSGKR